MKKWCFVLLLFSINSFASAYETVLQDLKKVDQFECHIEQLQDGNLRILTTRNNIKTNRYLDINLNDSQMEFKRTRDGWLLEKERDLATESRIFPAFLYGKEITKLVFRNLSGKGILNVYYVPSTTAFGSSVEFDCRGTNDVILKKDLICPNCISVQQ